MICITAKEYFANGLLKSIDNGVSKSDYTYNNRNLLTSESQTLAGRTPKIVSYAYDADGLRTDLAYPGSPAVTYDWTARGQLASVSADGPPPLATYTYDKLGRNTALVQENGITQSKSYDAANQLLANTHLKNGSPVAGHGYTLDTTGRRTGETFADGTTSARGYGYDAANQVTAANYGTGLTDSYAYDAMGNRTTASVASQGSGTQTYTANNVNQYTTWSGGLSAPSHDANGNQIYNGAGAIFTWDSDNRLLTIAPTTPANGEKSLVHSYDAQHRRVATTVREWTGSGWQDIQCTHFIYDGWNVIEEYVSVSQSSSNSVLAKTLTWGIDLSGSLQGAGGVGGLLMVEEIYTTSTTAYHFQYDGNGITRSRENRTEPSNYGGYRDKKGIREPVMIPSSLRAAKTSRRAVTRSACLWEHVTSWSNAASSPGASRKRVPPSLDVPSGNTPRQHYTRSNKCPSAADPAPARFMAR